MHRTKSGAPDGSVAAAYVHDVNRGLPVMLDDGTRSYVWGPPITNLGLLYAVDRTSNMLAYHANGRGGVVAVTDGTKSVAETYITDEFGVPTVRECQAPCSGQPFLFAGEPWDDEPNLLFLRARYYDPGMGRFLTRDPMRGAKRSPLSLNRYVYAGNNPSTWGDASGLDADGDPNTQDSLDDDDDPTTPVPASGGVAGGAQPGTFGTMSGGRFVPSAQAYQQGPAPQPTGLSPGMRAYLSGSGTQSNLSSLQASAHARAAELQSMLPAGFQGRVTMGAGIARDATGSLRTIVATSEPGGYLRPGVSLRPGEVLARGTAHAEQNVIAEAEARGWELITVGAGRPICPICAADLYEFGTVPASPLR